MRTRNGHIVPFLESVSRGKRKKEAMKRKKEVIKHTAKIHLQKKKKILKFFKFYPFVLCEWSLLFDS